MRGCARGLINIISGLLCALEDLVSEYYLDIMITAHLCPDNNMYSQSPFVLAFMFMFVSKGCSAAERRTGISDIKQLSHMARQVVIQRQWDTCIERGGREREGESERERERGGERCREIERERERGEIEREREREREEGRRKREVEREGGERGEICRERGWKEEERKREREVERASGGGRKRDM